jgi:hypothetical protein
MKEASIKDNSNNNNLGEVAGIDLNHISILILSLTIEAVVADLDTKKNLSLNLTSNTNEIHLA